jgi:hypothetical protein
MSLGLSNLTVSEKRRLEQWSALSLTECLRRSDVSQSHFKRRFPPGFFGVSGNKLVTMAAALPSGNYSVAVSAVTTETYWSADGNFTITVTPHKGSLSSGGAAPG